MQRVRAEENAILVGQIGSAKSEHVGGGAGARTSQWILHPLVDLLFSCGGLVWAFLALHYFVIEPTKNAALADALAVVTLLGTHLFSETHVAATLYRVYRNPVVRSRHGITTSCLALVALALGMGGLMMPGFVGVLLKVYFLWVVHHFVAQTYGLVLLYCHKGAYTLSRAEKFVVANLLRFTTLAAILKQCTFKESSTSYFLGQTIPFWGPLPEPILVTCLVVVQLFVCLLVVQIARKYIHQRALFPLPALLMIVTTLATFLTKSDVSALLWVYVPVFFHGTQYLVLTTAQHIKEQATGLSPSGVGKWSVAVDYFGSLFVVSAGLYVVLPLALNALGFSFETCFATVFTVVSLHHFATDQVIWKLRDPGLRKSLT
jgi:hypothetical protein